MSELPLVFVAGLLGSSHCIGMCGPFAILLGGNSRSMAGGMGRQLQYSAGRIFTYVMLGAAAGYSGLSLSTQISSWVSLPAILSIVAGAFLVYQGLVTAGVLRFGWSNKGGACLAGGILASFLRSPSWMGVFLAGLFTGFLPCGLVYGFLGLAASTRDVVSGAAMMAAFGLGTVPVMVITGVGGGHLAAGTRGKLLQLAAWCVVVAGVISIARGAGCLLAEDPVGACPLCG